MRLTKLMGGEYVTFQMWLKPEACGDGGAYRNDDRYLDEIARRECASPTVSSTRRVELGGALTLAFASGSQVSRSCTRCASSRA